jgi:ABC-type transport system substrate-binding protein
MAGSPTSAPASANTHTVQIFNSNPLDVELSAITAKLAANFTYTPGSTTGVTTADPAQNGQTLTWSGTFRVPANGSLSLRFGVVTASTPGTYTLAVGGTVSTPGFTLEGVTFHSGREFTNDDVRYNMLRVREPAHMQLGGMSSWYTFETPDKSTIILKSDQPWRLAFDFLEYLNITDKDLAESPRSQDHGRRHRAVQLVE